MACNKNYNQHEVAGCLTLSYREVNRMMVKKKTYLF